jgi:hypothetical protein
MIKSSVLFSVFIIVFFNIGLSQNNTSLLKNNYKVGTENSFIRLTDWLFIKHGWQGNTTDDLHWTSNSNGLNISQQSGLDILINGQDMGVGFLSNNNLNLLPINPISIDAIEVIDVPQLILGDFATKGRVNIKTKRLKPGINILLKRVLSNETGDTGPYSYVNGFDNLDRPISDIYFTINYTTNKWVTDFLVYKQNQITYTDPLIKHRVYFTLDNVNDASIWNPTIGGAFTSSYTNTKFKLDLSVRYFNSSRYFYYSNPLDHEIPIGLNLLNTAFSGSIKLKEKLVLYHASSFTIKDASIFTNANPKFNFDFQNNIIKSKIWLSNQNTKRKIDLGLKIEQVSANSEMGLDNTKIIMPSLFGNYKFKATEHSTQKIGVTTLMSAGKIAFKSSFANTIQINESQQLLTSIAYYENLFEESHNSDWFWINQGWDILSDYGRTYSKDSPFQKSKFITIDIIWENTFNHNTSLKLGVNIRSHTDVFFHRFESDKSLMLYNSQGATTINTSGKLIFPFSSTISNEINVRVQSVIQGDKELKEEINKTPQLYMNYNINFKPVKSFSLSAWVRYSSSTTWNTSQCNLCSKNQADLNIPYVFSIDFSANKWLWNQRLLVSLLLRNLSNNYNRYHPKGVKNDLTMYLSLTANLNQGIVQDIVKKICSK